METIPGIGRKTGMMLVVLTDGFERFNTASELCSYCGLTPIIRQSRTSVQGRPRISKIGNKKLEIYLVFTTILCCVTYFLFYYKSFYFESNICKNF